MMTIIRPHIRSFFLTLALVCVFCSASVAQTQIPDFLRVKGGAPAPEAKSWVLMESKTGWLIAASNEHKRVDPASLTKIMTSFMVFEALIDGKLNADDKVYISKKAWKAPGSRMFLNVDTSATIRELLNGLIIQSGNDAAVALAEHLGGSESGFAGLMNDKARELGMANTNYINASGLPGEKHYTTAFDTALLSRALIEKYPAMYGMFSIQEYTYNDITQPNRNRLLWRDDSYDGLKTGYTKAAGYCLAGSAVRDNTRFIGVVMGAESPRSRVQSVGALIEYGFSQYETMTLFGPAISSKMLPLFKGEQKQVSIGSPTEVSIVLPRGQQNALQLSYQLPERLIAPLAQSDEVGVAEISFEGNLIGHVKLKPTQDYPLGPLWSQLIDAVKLKVF